MTETQTTVAPKVIDDETRIEAARYVATQVETCSAYSYQDLVQEAWIILDKRMGQNFHSSVSYAAGDLHRKIYGNRMKEKAFHSRWLLTNGSLSCDEDISPVKADPSQYDNMLEREDVYNELLLFSRSIKKEDAFIILANFDNPVPVLKDLRETTTEGASQRLTVLRREIKKKYDLDFFND